MTENDYRIVKQNARHIGVNQGCLHDPVRMQIIESCIAVSMMAVKPNKFSVGDEIYHIVGRFPKCDACKGSNWNMTIWEPRKEKITKVLLSENNEGGVSVEYETGTYHFPEKSAYATEQEAQEACDNTKPTITGR